MPDSEPLARGIIESIDDERIVLALPGTDYRIDLALTVPAKAVKIPVGRRIKGRIETRALRIHPARGGGRFIEPVDGQPRIVAGTVLQVDAEGRRALVDVAVPIWMSWKSGQDVEALQPGGLVNCYVESGATFTPA